MFVRADKSNRCSEQMFVSDRWIVAANRTNVRLRQDPISGPEICKPNKCSPADTAADIVPHARPEDKSRDRNQNTRRTCSRSGTRCKTRGTGCTRQTFRPSPKPDARSRAQHAEKIRKQYNTKRGNAVQAKTMPLELILYASWYLYSLMCYNCLKSANNRT